MLEVKNNKLCVLDGGKREEDVLRYGGQERLVILLSRYNHLKFCCVPFHTLYMLYKIFISKWDCINFLTLSSTPASAVWCLLSVLDITLLSDVIGYFLIAKTKGGFFFLIILFADSELIFLSWVFSHFLGCSFLSLSQAFIISFFSVLRNVGVLLGYVLGFP